MTTPDPLEYLRQTEQRRHQTEQRRTEQQFELVTDVVDTFKAMHKAEQALYQARRRYIESFKKATHAQWRAKELREAGLPTPKISVLKRRMDFRYLMAPPAKADTQGPNENGTED
ncbi:hypothetical protein J2809_002545 [Arthrobacter pascens]|uniref:hypothetical protein n=1 Tax=Arthrobacter pascens TaxID=1677 RepID=UPI0028630757|nr:hypothetical protein [Arthrobacter pascens]MDR6558175.1 hypothetical protein [Arthrobacter pascens]